MTTDVIKALEAVSVALEHALANSWTPDELCETQSPEDAKEEWTFRLEENHATVKQLLTGPQPISTKAAASLAARWLAEPVPSAVKLHAAFEALAKATGAPGL